MTEVNPYQAPESSLSSAPDSVGGSLEKGLSGDYDFKISDLFNQAWELSKGFKATYWGALLIIFGVNFALSFVSMPFQNSTVLMIVFQVVTACVVYPLSAGFALLLVYKAAGREVSTMQITGYYNRILPIVLLNILILLLVLLGTVLLIVPGIYLAVSYIFAIPLMLDKNMGIWEAMEASRKTVSHKWFGFFGYVVVSVLMMMVAGMLLAIPLIWVLPLVSLAYGLLYTQILGVSGE